ncbi:MAG TPA: molybdate ABC transporter substrate-binding protein [Acidimicrobiaceae bacterium]|nr:molybdate ABC transporter substrate-binding protein [Acidimicrobiaceae bacterium]
MRTGRHNPFTLLLCAGTVGLLAWLTVFSQDDDHAVLRVLVASSLVDAATNLGERWTADSGMAVEVIPGGSNHLAAQIRDGAPADAFLSADETLLERLRTDGRLVGSVRHSLARNHLVVARPANGPDREPIDLHDPALVLVACAPEVPCGAVVVQWFGDLPVDSLESSARATATRLVLGEADLGIVYATDVASHPDLVAAWPQDVPKPDDPCPCVAYGAAALSSAGSRFVSFLTTTEARTVLTDHGFALVADS